MKNKKRLITLATTVALLGAVGIGSTLAYFTDSEDADNVITTGHVDIALSGWGEEDENGSKETIGNLVPGDTVVCNPIVTVDKDSEDAYIRCKFTVTLKDAEENKVNFEKDENGELIGYLKDLELLLEENVATYVNAGWSLNDTDAGLGLQDGTYVFYAYYNNVVEAETAVPVFAQDGKFVIPKSWGNAWADKSLTIDVVAEAVQADNFTPGYNAYNEDGTVAEDAVIVNWNEVTTIEKYN